MNVFTLVMPPSSKMRSRAAISTGSSFDIPAIFSAVYAFTVAEMFDGPSR